MADATSVTSLPVVGRDTVRVDGPLKVSGVARYSSDRVLPGMLYAVPVTATVASGHVASIDTQQAVRMPGVRKVYTRETIGRFYRVPKASKARLDERRPPFEDDVVRYYGQYVALVVADTFENATAAAARIKVTYADASAPDVSTHLSASEAPKPDTQRGDADKAFAAAPVQVDHTYATPAETHNPIELHASVAAWDGARFTLYETSQAVM